MAQSSLFCADVPLSNYSLTDEMKKAYKEGGVEACRRLLEKKCDE